MGKQRLTREPEITAAIISVAGTLVGTLLIGVLLGFMEGRIGLGPVVAVITLLLVLSIWVLLAFRWGIRLAGAAAAAMVIVGSVLFLIATAARFIPFGAPSATSVAAAASPTPATLPPAPTPSPTEQAAPFIAGECRITEQRDGDIYVKNCDGSGVYQVTNHPAQDGSPAWSPDGHRIVFYSERDGQPGPEGKVLSSLYIVDADGSNLTRLTGTEDNDHGPSWSPDGSRIAFHRNCTLAVVNPDGTNLVTLVEKEKEGLCVENPVWSPDGQRLAFVSYRSGAEAEDYYTAWVVNADGTSLLKLDEFQARYAYSLWSPDGGQVAVHCKKDGDVREYLMNSDGSGESLEVEFIPESWFPWHWPQWGGEEIAKPLPPTPGPSTAEEARAFAEPILAAIADRPPTWSDDFSDPGSGWGTGPAEWGENGYQDGEYFMIANPPPPGAEVACSGAAPPLPEIFDFVLEIDGRFVSVEAGDWQLPFRDGRDGVCTVFLTPDGGVSIGVGGVTLADLKGDPMKGGYETNRLQVIAKGPQIALYVNREPLWLVYDETLSAGSIGLWLCNHGATPLRVHFDNFKVWDISGLSP